MNLVKQYGGRSIDTLEKIQAIAKKTAVTREPGDGLVIVTGAMAGLAENIMKMANKISSDIAKPELDTLFAAGEQETAALMTIALREAGVDAVTITELRGRSLDLKDNIYDSNTIEIDTEAVEALLDEGNVIVVAGFQGIGDYAAKDLSGRSGASSTAVAIAAQLGCPCELYGDIDAIHTADPEIYPKAKAVGKISYEELMEMVELGDIKLEGRAIELASKYNVEVFIGDPTKEDSTGGTYIMNQNLIVESMPVTGISISENCVIYTLKGIRNDGAAVADMFELLSRLDINIDMISQQIAGDGTCNVVFSCDERQSAALDKALAENQTLSAINTEKQSGLALISLVGTGMASHSGVAGKVFTVLANEGIRYYQITTSEISISVTVDNSNKGKAVIALGEAFNL